MNSLFLLLALAQADVPPPAEQDSAYPDNPESAAWGEFSQFGFGGGGGMVRYGLYARDDDGVAQYWFHSEAIRTNTGFVGGWVNSVECSGTRDVMAALTDLDMPVPDLPDIPAYVAQGLPRPPAFDGTAYRVTARSSYGDGLSARITIESWGNSAPGVWVESMFEALAPCWQELTPEDL